MANEGLKYQIETYGCQMNLYDSAVVRSLLNQAGYSETESCEEADVIVINSCAVRGHAEERVLGRIGELKSWKSREPGRVLIAIGCVAQERGQSLLEKFSQLDLVLGTEDYRRITIELGKYLEDHRRVIKTDLSQPAESEIIAPAFDRQVTAFLAVMRGCDNFCSYCIVPYVRGREYSRPAGDIMSEIECLVGRGIKEITLVGQNVNSYQFGNIGFPDLLAMAADISELDRLRFITSHPKDCGKKLLEVMAGHKKICQHLHLPLQSGSNRVLGLMNRKYTREQFLEIIARARAMMPDIAITSDLIAGFPSETEEDFDQTLKVMELVKFDSAFTYKYSVRPETKAGEMDGHLADEVRQARLERMISLQQRISLESNTADIGRVFPVLVEKAVPQRGQMMGRNAGNKPVAFAGATGISPGDMVSVKITKATQSTLVGTMA